MFFSVIVPVYNVEKYIFSCVESVLCQTYRDFELILVDDGSTDCSSSLCDEYARKDSRVKVIHKANGGQSTARNLGLDHACGEYICFLDSDDFYTTPCFLEQIAQAAESGVDVIIFRYQKFYENGQIDSCGISMADLHDMEKPELLETLVKRDAFFCSCWSKSIRASVLKENHIRFDEELSCEDMDWYYKVLCHTNRLRVVDEAYVSYRQRANSVTSVFRVKTVEDYLWTLRKWRSAFEKIENGLERTVMLSSLAKLYCNLLISYSRNADKLKALKNDIFSFKDLLKYQMNPRVRKIGCFYKLFGLDLTCFALKVLDKVKTNGK